MIGQKGAKTRLVEKSLRSQDSADCLNLFASHRKVSVLCQSIAPRHRCLSIYMTSSMAASHVSNFDVARCS